MDEAENGKLCTYNRTPINTCGRNHALIKESFCYSFKNHHWATIVIIIDLGNNHPQLKLVGKIFLRNEMFSLKVPPRRTVINYKGKKMQLYSAENGQNTTESVQSTVTSPARDNLFLWPS